MKRIITILLAVSILLALSGCTKKFTIKLPGESADISSEEESDVVSSSAAESNNNTPSSNSSKSTSSKAKNSSKAVSSQSSAENTRPEKVTKIYDANIYFTVNASKEYIYKDSKNGNTLPYRLYLPENYDKSKKYPVVLFLHGAGELGNDNVMQISNISGMFKNNGDFIAQSILICPQTPEWWYLDRGNYGDGRGTLSSAYNLLTEIMKTYSCDSNRIYLTGLSMGGYATWEMLSRYADTFAAAIPLCGPTCNQSVEKFKNLPIRIYHGTSDSTVSYQSSQTMYNRIVSAGGKNTEFIKLEGYNHDVWTYVYGNREIFSWLFAQNKATNPTMKYEKIPYFKVVDKNGKTVISDKDIVSHSFPGAQYNSDKMDCKIYLSDAGKESLTKAYKASGGAEFTVYFLNRKIYSFTATTPPSDKYFVISGVITNKNYDRFGNWLAMAVRENQK